MTSGAPVVRVTALLAEVNSGVTVVEPTVTAMETCAPAESRARMFAVPRATPMMVIELPLTPDVATLALLELVR